MRLNCFLVIVVLMMNQGAQGQTSTPEPVTGKKNTSRFTIGSKGGYGHSFMFPYSNCTYHSSWDVGLAMLFSGEEKWGLGIDYLYAAEGVTFTDGTFTLEHNLSYVRVPIRLNYFFAKLEDDFRPKITLGPSFGFLLNNQEFSDYKSFDIGYSLTAGFNFRLHKSFWVTWDASYYQGLMDIATNNTDNDRNGNVRMDIGLMLGF